MNAVFTTRCAQSAQIYSQGRFYGGKVRTFFARCILREEEKSLAKCSPTPVHIDVEKDLETIW